MVLSATIRSRLHCRPLSDTHTTQLSITDRPHTVYSGADTRADHATPAGVLRDVFGFNDFRPGQREVIDAVLAGRDCIALMPTGAGKSLTYQLPARLLKGTVLVISPLISLMKDQVDAVAALGFSVAAINSTLSLDERIARMEAFRAWRVRIGFSRA